MKTSTLSVLACPACHGTLVLSAAPAWPTLTAGSLCCPRCQRDYPVVNEIPRFVEQEALTGLNRRFARLYDWFSYVYAPYSRLMFALLGGEGPNRREVLDRLEHPARGGRVLEVSIGPGVNLPYLAGAPGVAEIYGLDISPGQLRQCQRLCRRRGWAVDLFLGNAEQLPFRDGSFDCVFHIGGINFFNDKRAAIQEMIRVARGGTKIVIVDEQERAARLYERTLPGFRRSFRGNRPAVTAPVELVPANMDAVSLTSVWRGWFYCLEFRKPHGRFIA
jgi:ubiquinone/menaquinone biosynthesis C-methylase UbiE